MSNKSYLTQRHKHIILRYHMYSRCAVIVLRVSFDMLHAMVRHVSPWISLVRMFAPSRESYCCGIGHMMSNTWCRTHDVEHMVSNTRSHVIACIFRKSPWSTCSRHWITQSNNGIPIATGQSNHDAIHIKTSAVNVIYSLPVFLIPVRADINLLNSESGFPQPFDHKKDSVFFLSKNTNCL